MWVVERRVCFMGWGGGVCLMWVVDCWLCVVDWRVCFMEKGGEGLWVWVCVDEDAVVCVLCVLCVSICLYF